MAKSKLFIAIPNYLVNDLNLVEQIQQLKTYADVEFWSGVGNPSPDVVERAAGACEVLMTGWGTPSLNGCLKFWKPDTSPLRLIAHTAGSIKHLATREVVEKGLIIVTANDALAEAVAEFTFTSIFAMRRQMLQSAIVLKTRREAYRPYRAMHEMSGSTIGIIGSGAIGRRVIQLFQPWEVTLLLSDPYCTPEQALQMGAHELVELDDLLSRSDIVSLHAPVTPTTLGMLGKREFARMKDGALFVNTARGKLIDHVALLAQLQSGRIEALLDVTDPEEPLPVDSPFYNLDNCVVLPHIAGHSWETRQRQAIYCIQDVLNYYQGRPLKRAIDPQRWDHIA